MEIADIFVGGVAAAIGVAAMAVSAANWNPGFHFWVGRVFDARYGRTPARIVYALVGAALVGLGLAIMLGFAPNARRQSRSASPLRVARATCLDRAACMPLKQRHQ
jgi:hypothetical protein